MYIDKKEERQSGRETGKEWNEEKELEKRVEGKNRQQELEKGGINEENSDEQ